MRHYPFLAVTLAAALLAASVAPASAAESRPTHRCAAIANDRERLACYDAAFGKAAPVRPADPKSAEKDFGLTDEQLRKKYPERAREAEEAGITAKITKVDQDGVGGRIVTLDNGQVWAEKSGNRTTSLRPGEQVQIKKGMLGSYILMTRSNAWTRVRRVK